MLIYIERGGKKSSNCSNVLYLYELLSGLQILEYLKVLLVSLKVLHLPDAPSDAEIENPKIPKKSRTLRTLEHYKKSSMKSMTYKRP